MKRWFAVVCVLVACVASLYALDKVTLTDGRVLEGSVTSYELGVRLSIDVPGSGLLEFVSSEIASVDIGTSGTLLAVSSQPDAIVFHPGNSKAFYYVPPRYTYRGTTYNVETGWAYESRVFEFFSILREQHPDMDPTTSELIATLERKIAGQGRTAAWSGAISLAGLMTAYVVTPFEDDAPPFTPVQAGFAIGGLAAYLGGSIVMFATMFFVNHNEYLPRIANSFNSRGASEANR